MIENGRYPFRCKEPTNNVEETQVGGVVDVALQESDADEADPFADLCLPSPEVLCRGMAV